MESSSAMNASGSGILEPRISIEKNEGWGKRGYALYLRAKVRSFQRSAYEKKASGQIVYVKLQ